jgi:hypothetical protein
MMARMDPQDGRSAFITKACYDSFLHCYIKVHIKRACMLNDIFTLMLPSNRIIYSSVKYIHIMSTLCFLFSATATSELILSLLRSSVDSMFSYTALYRLTCVSAECILAH